MAQVTTPQWKTTDELYGDAIDANKALASSLPADDLIGLSIRALVQALERRGARRLRPIGGDA
jgi:hypothetical protein